ncbi:hypothetical protein TFLX_01003 [Thermoflexales bacterium]|nr:hypothetical protein TFLX_01003 [Thermoflexales bacterium]
MGEAGFIRRQKHLSLEHAHLIWGRERYGIVLQILPIIKEKTMKLSAPTMVVWVIALVLGIAGLLGFLVTIPVISGLAFWLVLIGLALMLLATAVKGM